jgi:adenine-specific DNA-methyltransferase
VSGLNRHDDGFVGETLSALVVGSSNQIVVQKRTQQRFVSLLTRTFPALSAFDDSESERVASDALDGYRLLRVRKATVQRFLREVKERLLLADEVGRARLPGDLYEQALRFSLVRQSKGWCAVGSRAPRRRSGSFFTPHDGVSFLVREGLARSNAPDPIICDPACGGGAFLAEALIHLASEHDDRRRLIMTILTGIDNDPLAVELTRFALRWLACGARDTVADTNTQVYVGDSVGHSVDDLSGIWRRRFAPVLRRGGFDLVVGNPPFGSRAGSGVVKGRNSAARFTTRSLELLADNGVLALVLPSAMTYVSSWSKQRERLLESCPPRVLVDLGQGFSGVLLEQVLLVAGGRGRKMLKCVLRDGKSASVPLREPFVSPTRFRAGVNGWRRRLIERLVALPTLGDFCRIETGVGLLHECSARSRGIRVIRGRDVGRYRIDSPLSLPASFELGDADRLRGPKVIAQDIVAHVLRPKPHLLPAAAVDVKQRVPINTVTCLFSRVIRLELLAAYLNSRLFSWWASFATFNRAVRTVHLRGEALASFPFPRLPGTASVCAKTVSRLVESATEDSAEAWSKTDGLSGKRKAATLARAITLLSRDRQKTNGTEGLILDDGIDNLVVSLFNLSREEVSGVFSDVPRLIGSLDRKAPSG